jgi:transcriptional regulator with XRE-family HTH domain
VFGQLLKAVRQHVGWTQLQLADKSGVPVGTVRDYEQGKRDPLLSTAGKLADALGVSLDVLAGRAAAPGVPQGATQPEAGQPSGQKPSTQRRGTGAQRKGKGKGA